MDITGEGVPAVYAEAILVCNDLSPDVPADAAFECGDPRYEPKTVCYIFDGLFRGLYCAPKCVFLE